MLAQQPSAAKHAPTLAEEERWVEWMKPYLECFGKHLQRKTRVEVDVDDREETAELVQEFLLNGYQKVRCRLLGDFLFKRGRFSWDTESRFDDDIQIIMMMMDLEESG